MWGLMLYPEIRLYFKFIFSQVPAANKHLKVIPEALVDLVIWHQPDWLLPDWSRLQQALPPALKECMDQGPASIKDFVPWQDFHHIQ